ncbi:hypothetical protein HU200_005058 [Digitaria exilis]|uniref:F-box domain-containing protein n=1 Tax=Digitaria exilis TaxID=1010633 RepID=A0A835KT90_9POAL|nr:hypothetical protein HU200_005058 [Digitaria exilis]
MEDTPASVRDCLELPLDALASIFDKLGAIEILMGAGLVCHSWLKAAKVPELWRSVNILDHKVVHELDRVGSSAGGVEEPKINGNVLRAMAKVAVDRSGGQLLAFAGSPGLRALGLISSDGVSNEGFSELVAKCPLLENLMLSLCNNVHGREVYEGTGRACPQLKNFVLGKRMLDSLIQLYYRDDELGSEALGATAMHGLRRLTLLGSDLTNDELAVILDSCPHLELLDLRDCFQLVVDDALRARCTGIKSLTLPCQVD